MNDYIRWSGPKASQVDAAPGSAAAKRLAEMETLRQGYLDAFRSANPNRPEPILTYEGGWFLHHHNDVDLALNSLQGRYRAGELANMRDRLIERTAEKAGPEAEQEPQAYGPRP